MIKMVLKSILAPVIICALLLIGTTNVNAENLTLGEIKAAKDKVEKVVLLKTPLDMGDSKEDVKKNAEQKFEKAVKIIEKYFTEQGIAVSGDFDDAHYQKSIMSLGVSLDHFNESEQPHVLDFVKFMDFYKNYSLNERITDLKEKYEYGIMTEENLEELLTFAPADSNFTIDSASSNIEPMTLYPNGYDNIKVRDYAYKWTSNTSTLRNNTGYPYYSKYYNCTSCWNDCTNFVSQAIRAGGMKYRGSINYASSSNWYYSNTKPSHSWGGAHNFYLHWKSRAGVASTVSALQTGDVVSADFGGDGTIDHAAIITKNTGSASSNKYLTQHTTDRKETTTLKNWYNSGYKVYGYEMDKASN